MTVSVNCICENVSCSRVSVLFACVEGRLLYKSYSDINSSLVVIDVDSLLPVDHILFPGLSIDILCVLISVRFFV